LRVSLFEILKNRAAEISPRMADRIVGLYEDGLWLDERIETVTVEIEKIATEQAACRRLMSVPGVGSPPPWWRRWGMGLRARPRLRRLVGTRAAAIQHRRQAHLGAQLNETWRQRGVERPLQARMGINTGYCNVGNFGSDDRMDYTIIGAEANLAARLQSIAEPGGICLSYETYALVRDLVRARPLDPIVMKGISREIVPYRVEGLLGELAQRQQVISEHVTGLDLFLDLEALDDAGIERAKRRLSEALQALAVRERSAA
jgi:hypothetical protein